MITFSAIFPSKIIGFVRAFYEFILLDMESLPHLKILRKFRARWALSAFKDYILQTFFRGFWVKIWAAREILNEFRKNEKQIFLENKMLKLEIEFFSQAFRAHTSLSQLFGLVYLWFCCIKDCWNWVDVVWLLRKIISHDFHCDVVCYKMGGVLLLKILYGLVYFWFADFRNI